MGIEKRVNSRDRLIQRINLQKQERKVIVSENGNSIQAERFKQLMKPLDDIIDQEEFELKRGKLIHFLESFLKETTKEGVMSFIDLIPGGNIIKEGISLLGSVVNSSQR